MHLRTTAIASNIGTLALALPCQADTKSDFVNPPLKFRARPPWFWNNTVVTTAEVEAQLQGNHDRSGYGGLAPLPFGEASGRVTAYRIEYWNGSTWSACASGTTLGTNKVDRFNPVTTSRVRLSIDRVSSGTPSICEFDIHLDDGPNLARSDALVVHERRKGARAFHVNSPNESNLRHALDLAVGVYDVDFEGSQKLRYIHKVMGKTEVYFFANPSDQNADALVRLRGKVTPEAWDPHTGQFSIPQYSHIVEDGQPVTRVKLSLSPIHSVFIIGKHQ